MATTLAVKLNIKEGMKIRVTGKPADVTLDGITVTTAAAADGVITFIKTLADVETKCAAVIDAAAKDRLAWIVYPKAGQLGTDLNRDILWKQMQKKGIQGVRQIAIDDVWSAMRFRPAK
jgi:hypothetical protein